MERYTGKLLATWKGQYTSFNQHFVAVQAQDGTIRIYLDSNPTRFLICNETCNQPSDLPAMAARNGMPMPSIMSDRLLNQ